MENTLVNSLLDSNKDMTDDYLLVRGGVAPSQPMVPDRRGDTRSGIWKEMLSKRFSLEVSVVVLIHFLLMCSGRMEKASEAIY